ncbi:Uma2 family endonuclease [Streptomyces sp. NPDC057705]|uniref:Uma2 family endonuclease n=1 Tax=Streptomyces sp. NPDC057705 TaxID=3346222 RepID=UPI0036BA14F1
MTALAHETLEAVMPKVATPPSDLDDVLWQAWKAMELPEGYHAEIVSHGQIANRLRDKLVVFLAPGEFVARQDMNVIHKRKVWIPDLFIALEDAEEHITEDGLGIDASAVRLIAEVVSPGRDSLERDRSRKRRACARAGIPTYLIIDDFDGHGTVSVLTGPVGSEARYASEVRMPYGTEVIIPEGPAKGFVIDESVTGALRTS